MCYILLYSILFHSILFDYIIFSTILFYAILLHSKLCYSTAAQLVSDMLIECVCLETFRPSTKNETQVLHRVMHLPITDVVPRSAVVSGETDLTHMPRGVSSRQNC